MPYSYSIKVGVFKVIKEKINKSTVVVCEVLKPIKILTTIEYCQLLLETCIAVDTYKKVMYWLNSVSN